MLSRLALHFARRAERASAISFGREKGKGESGFLLPAFTPSLTLKIALITGTFWETSHWTELLPIGLIR